MAELANALCLRTPCHDLPELNLTRLMNSTRHPCPCCGYRTYERVAGGTMQICPVCFWEDAPGEWPHNGSNPIPLAQAQANFEKMGACESQYIDLVRSPSGEEARSADWLSVDTFRNKVLDMIEEAFSEVALDGGVTLHQTWVIDEYGDEKEYLQAKLKDPETRWQDLSEAKLTDFSDSMVFFDGNGFRFHLPAFMRHALLTSVPDVYQAESEGVLLALDGGLNDSYHKKSLRLLSPPQLGATAAFLHFFAKYGEDGTQNYSRRGLKHGLDTFTPAFVNRATL
ncbi:CPCC family cysteine-rich protein [Luteolibacter sp. GHJ8]|uniref:CPCC family cysteine-rich protein n=1 Tax=Luteolibacter rhizosphaerae TaxID=2989719 RepID=A0ABT3G6T8_9BACT|nr:DUF6714 family protein [Luteolibacter rhizosphaerae]MCW1915279.1 CPCC family cysteine-rich protein [Luteolibacter rhizosphaerae]